jgi:ATP-dependent Lhr-like helicase
MSDSAFALLHPGVQKAIWSMQWKEFRPIQLESIHHVLEKSGHLIITAQTATGKTEAAFLPVISKLAANPQPSIQALYVGPLKALINDQFSRLEKLCGSMEIPVHRWHGDVPANQKKELRRSPAGILLITPESLESNFINFGRSLTKLYQHLDFVVIDELHSFLNNVRGIHLRSLLARLNTAVGTNPRIIGLSATLSDPQAASRFLCPDEPESVKVLSDPNAQREIKFGIKVHLRRASTENEKLLGVRLKPTQALQLAERLTAAELKTNSPCKKETAPELSPILRETDRDPDDELDEIAEDIIRNFTNSTSLIFVNSKKAIENLAAKLHERAKQTLPLDPFVVHHGSISKELREEAEFQLKSDRPTTAICSSTLEMGIDIGAVRAVGQVDAPWSVTAMVQRLGRSGRKDGEPSIMRMYVREDSPHFSTELSDLLYPDLLRAIALTRLMLQKWLEPPNTEQMHVSTFVHQLLSCLKQTGGNSAANLYEILAHRGPFGRISQGLFRDILKGLGERKVIEQMPEGDLILAPLGEKITSSFDFYAAFQGAEEFLVRSGEEHIGNLPVEFIPPKGESIILDGRRWRVDEIDAPAKTILVSRARGGRAPDFMTPGAELHTRVLQEMRQVLLNNDEPAWVDEAGRILLRAARTVAGKCGLLRNNILIMPHGVQWFPWIGSRGMLALKSFAIAAGIQQETDELSITYKVDSPEFFFEHIKQIANSSASASELASYVPVKASQKFDAFLPPNVLDIANGNDHLNVEDAKAAARQLTF